MRFDVNAPNLTPESEKAHSTWEVCSYSRGVLEAFSVCDGSVVNVKEQPNNAEGKAKQI